MKTFKKLAAALLCVVMLAVLSPAMAEDEHGPLWIGDYTLTYWIEMTSDEATHFTTLADHPFMKWMEEQTGVHINFIHPVEEQKEQQFNMMLASGNMYDLLYMSTYPGGPQASLDDGVYMDLTKYSDLIPNYLAAINYGDGRWDNSWEWGPEKDTYYMGAQPAFVDNLTTTSGGLWCFSQVWFDDYGAICGPLIRKDWLDDAGLDIPQTIDDWTEMLAAFKARGADVIPMSLSEYGYDYSSDIFASAYDIVAGWYYVKDGEVQEPGYAQPEFKDYLTLLNQWYAAGYVDPDFMNRSGDSLDSLLLSDKLGVLSTAWTGGAYYKQLYTGSDPDFELVAAPLPRLTEDQTLQYRSGYQSEPTCYSMVSGNCKNPEIACKWMNALYSKEAYLRAVYGVEGESYEMIDGAPYYTDWFYENRDSQFLTQTYLWAHRVIDSYRASIAMNAASQEAFRSGDNADVKAMKTWGENSVAKMNIGFVTFPGDSWGTMYDPYSEAETYALPMILKYITGTESLDTFDTYLATARATGFDDSYEIMKETFYAQHPKE